MKIAKTFSFEIKRIDEIKVYPTAIYINSAEKLLKLDRNLNILEAIVPGSESLLEHKSLYKATGNALFKDGEKVLETTDDINQIDMNCYKNLVGITDDSGSVTLYNVKSGQILVSKSKHQSIAVPLAFRPNLGRQLCTGGFESCVIIWDADRLTEKLRISFAPRPSQSGCNPPHVHSLCWNADGSTLYAGLGSGDIAVLKIPRVIKSISLEKIPITYLSAHTWSVSSIVCLNNSVMISGSIDKCIVFWRDGILISKLDLGVKINTMELYSECEILVGSPDSTLRKVVLETSRK
jgi:WD40 repeat protein